MIALPYFAKALYKGGRKGMDNYQQGECIIVPQKRDVGNRDTDLLGMALRFENHELCAPPFQRDYVWSEKKLIEWINTVISHKAIGVIVTYQCHDGTVEFLADGFQRLTATCRFLRTPQKYGFPFGPVQAKEYCYKYQITVQHRHYDDEFEAMKAFQNLNKGTALTPAEVHKGELTLKPRGALIYKRIPNIMAGLEMPIKSGINLGRRPASKYLRDTFALFYQYITKTKMRSFWETRKENDIGKSIESLLMAHIEEVGWNEEEIEKQIGQFQKYMASEIALLVAVQNQTGQGGKAFSPSALRWLLHLALWRKNCSRPIIRYKEFVRKLFVYWKQFPGQTFSSRFTLLSRDQKREVIAEITLRVGQLNRLERLCEYLQVEGLYYPLTRKRQGSPAIGIHASHKEPFSEVGEGEVFLEPAIENIARGARPVSRPDQ